MKKIYNYTFKLVCIYILVLSFFSISNFEVKVDYYDSNVYNINKEKMLDSVVLETTVEEEEDTNTDTLSDESINQEVDTSVDNDINEEIQDTIDTNIVEVINLVDTSSYTVLQQETVNISHYGHDCYGCTSGYTASGYYVGDGKIYYQDATFGSVRIVAADNKYPIGTILRLEYQDSTITAIVLDRGGAISDNSKYQIDLLETNEATAYNSSVMLNSKLEVLRLGY